MGASDPKWGFEGIRLPGTWIPSTVPAEPGKIAGLPWPKALE